MIYHYLLNHVYDKGGQDLSNIFYSLSEEQILEGETKLGFSFPSELRQFYQEIGFGNLTTPINPPPDYNNCSEDMVLHPNVVANFYHGYLSNNDLDSYMLPDYYEDFIKGTDDIPVFEMYDSYYFMHMKPKSDNPNAVWYRGYKKIEDSFERFIYNLYHDGPDYYSRDW